MAHWKAIVPQTILEKSFWAKCREDELASDDILTELSAKFPLNPTKRGLQVHNPLNTKKDVDLRIINAKTAQKMLILLRALLKNVSHEQIKQSIIRCDLSTLTSTITEQLIQCLPPQDQIERLKEIKKTGQKLSEAETFIATLGEIENLVPRLHSIKFRLGIDDMIQVVNPNITNSIAACEEVRTSRKFAKILELVLFCGNYMNSNSIYGQAHGFEISFLTKLKDTRDLNNKQSLLHYVVETIERKFPESLTFGDELHHAEKAVGVSFEDIREIIAEMTASLENLKSSLERSKVCQSPDDKFAEVMAVFAVQCDDQVGALTKMMFQMENSYQEVGEYFAFDIQKNPMGDFFSDIKMFKESFAKAYEEITTARQSRMKEEKTRQTNKAREQPQRQVTNEQQQKLPLIRDYAVRPQGSVCRVFKIKLDRIPVSGRYTL